MMPSAPPTTELPPAAHQRPKISFSIDSIVSGEKKEKEDSPKVLNRSHPQDLDSDGESPMSLTKDLKFPGKIDLLSQFRNVPLMLQNHLQQQINFNQQQLLRAENGSEHARYNFHIPPNKSSPDNSRMSGVNGEKSSVSSRSPSPNGRSQSPNNRGAGCSSPDSRSVGTPPNTSGEQLHRPNPIHLPPVPVQMGQGMHQFPHFPLGAPNFPVPGHPHHGVMPPWGPQPNPHHPVAHPLYPWLLARHSRMFPPRFGPGAELPAFLFQPFRKPKRIRTAFSPNQLLRLEHAFEKNHYVVGTERKQLAKSLSLSETQVKVWFQNRRTKHKRTETEEGPENKGSSSHSDNPLRNLSSSATSADSSTRHYSEEMSDDEELIMDDEYSGDEEEMAQVHTSFHNK